MLVVTLILCFSALLAIAATVAAVFITKPIIRVVVHECWAPIAAAYPARVPSNSASHRSFQSFKAGWLNLGWSMHTAADAEYLHLRPTLLARLIGVAPASIPWREMKPQPGLNPWLYGVVVRDHHLLVPRWCRDRATQAATAA